MPSLSIDRPEERFNVTINFGEENHIEISYKELSLTDINEINEVIIIDTNEDPLQVTIEDTTPLENHYIKTLIEDNLKYLNEPYILLLVRNLNEQLSVFDTPLGITHHVNTLILATPISPSETLEAFCFYGLFGGHVWLENNFYWRTLSR